jgi:CBS domain-containing protein
MNMNRLILPAETVKDLMTPSPVSISEHATVREAAAALTRLEISAVPVINDAGRPVGVLSRADLVRHEAGRPKPTEVGAIMTPAVVSVAPQDLAWEAVAQMAAFKVHRLYVVDDNGVLVGVVSALDIVCRLRRDEAGS